MLIDIEKIPMETSENVLDFVKEVDIINEKEDYVLIDGERVPLVKASDVLAFVQEVDKLNNKCMCKKGCKGCQVCDNEATYLKDC